MASRGSKLFCREHPDAPLVEDYHAGDMICTACGLVVGDRVIDVGSEWRTFSNEKAGVNCVFFQNLILFLISLDYLKNVKSDIFVALICHSFFSFVIAFSYSILLFLILMQFLNHLKERSISCWCK